MGLRPHGHRERPLPSHFPDLSHFTNPCWVPNKIMAPKAPRLKTLSGLSSHAPCRFSQTRPQFLYLNIHPGTLPVPKPLVSCLQVILFFLSLAWPKQSLPIDSNFLSLFFFSTRPVPDPQPRALPSQTERPVRCSALDPTIRYE